jgi:hypothetical protein
MGSDFAGDGSPRPERDAEVAGQHAAEPGDVLAEDWLIESDAGAQVGHALRRHLGVGPQHDRHRVARDQPDHQEGDDGDAEEDEDKVDQALAEEAHGVLVICPSLSALQRLCASFETPLRGSSG